MDFLEIRKIDRKPFDEDWIANFYDGFMNDWGSKENLIRLMLMCRYLERFGKTYGFDMELLETKYYVPTQNFKNLDLLDDLTEIVYELEEQNGYLFERIAGLCGFEFIYFPTSSDYINPEIWDKDDEEQTKFLRNHFSDLDKKWYPFIMKNRKIIMQSNQYMEDGEIFIMRNETIGLYRLLCQKYASLIETNLLKEKREIDAAISDLKFPLQYYNQHEEGYMEETYYICFDIGFDGCSYLNFVYLNYNWVLTCFVLEKFLTDFNEKLKQLLEIEEYRRAVS